MNRLQRFGQGVVNRFRSGRARVRNAINGGVGNLGFYDGSKLYAKSGTTGGGGSPG